MKHKLKTNINKHLKVMTLQKYEQKVLQITEYQGFDMDRTRYFYHKHWHPVSKHYILCKEVEHSERKGVD